ncbi:MAG: DUF2283 domain-containing protein [Actinomycetaceae bacterium]|nr:DUF2283 domain-containing protein [Actinomycetaceae bacterium]
MNITYDSVADCAYIEFLPHAEPVYFLKCITPTQNNDNTYEMNIDMDNNGHIIGIEILFASNAFPQETLRTFHQL